jgi:peptide/nickel transport system permease protein
VTTKTNRYMPGVEPQLQEIRYGLYILTKNKVTFAGVLCVLFLIGIALLAPWIAPYPEDALGATHPAQGFQDPDFVHLFGTDEAGRDILSRVIFGAPISLQIGVLVIVLTLLIGVPLGLLAGYTGGAADELIMRVTDMFLSFPPLLLALVIAAILGPSLTNSMIAIAIAWWPWYTRLSRGQVISLKERPFVEAARATGVKGVWIMFRHILPNSLTPIVVQASLDFGSVILTAASLSFLGLGAQPPTPEWGLMISTGRYYFLDHWQLATFPGLAILGTVLAFNLMSDGLREALAPRLRRT